MSEPVPPLDICEFIDKYITDTSLAGLIAKNTCASLANDSITLNEFYNAIFFFIDGIVDNTDTQSLVNFANTTFVNYTRQWVPFQYGTLIVTVLVIIFFLSLSGYIDYPMAVLIGLGSASFLAVIAVVQLSILDDFVNERETTFQNLISAIINKVAPVAGKQAITAYFKASQLTINNGITDGLTKTLTDPNPTTIPTISPPYQRLSLFKTVTPESTSTQPAIFPVRLSGITGAGNGRLQNSLVIYVMNVNPFNKGTFGSFVSGSNPDTGIINIINATPSFPADGMSKVNLSNFPAEDSDKGIGVLLYPGELKCFVNVAINHVSFPGADPFAVDTWVELTSDIRPFVQKLTFTASGTLLPTHRIENIHCSEDIVITIDNDYGYDGQELIIVANITPSSGSIWITTNRDPTETGFPLIMTNLQKLTLQFQRTSPTTQLGSGWLIIAGPE